MWVFVPFVDNSCIIREFKAELIKTNIEEFQTQFVMYLLANVSEGLSINFTEEFIITFWGKLFEGILSRTFRKISQYLTK